MAVRLLKKNPFVADAGKDSTEYMLASMEFVKSDVVNYNDSSPVNVFLVPAYSFIASVTVQVVTAFDGNLPSVSLGVTGAGNTGRHIDVGDADWKTAGFYQIDKPYDYSADATLIATIVPSGSTQGKVVFWVEYRSRTQTQG